VESEILGQELDRELGIESLFFRHIRVTGKVDLDKTKTLAKIANRIRVEVRLTLNDHSHNARRNLVLEAVVINELIYCPRGLWSLWEGVYGGNVL
jgi:hypothetical protein